MVSLVAKENQDGSAFGERLKALRLAAGLTLEKLAERVGMKHQNVARLESGGRQPSWDTVVRFAKALGVQPNDFLPESDSE